MKESGEWTGGPGDIVWEAQFRSADDLGTDLITGDDVNGKPVRPALINELLGDVWRNPTRSPEVALALYLSDRAEVDALTVEHYRGPGVSEENARAARRAKRIAFGLAVD